MAEIHVERKGPVIWPWIIGLILLAVLVWGLVEMYGDRGAVVGDEVTPDTIVNVPTAAPAPPPPSPTPVAPVDTALPMAPTGAAPGTTTPPATPGSTPG